MSNQPELPKKIRYKYVMDDSVRMSTAHGVWTPCPSGPNAWWPRTVRWAPR